MYKHKLLFLLMIVPFISSCKKEYGYNLNLSGDMNVDLITFDLKALDENENEVTNFDYSKNYYLHVHFSGINQAEQELANYEVEIVGNNCFTSLDVEDARTANIVSNSNETKKSLSLGYTVGKYIDKEIDENIVFRFQVSEDCKSIDTLSNRLNFKFSYCSLNNLESNLSLSAGTIEKYSNSKHQYFKLGSYPQKKVNKEDISINYPTDGSLFSYNGGYYCSLDDGIYMVEPVLWRVLEKNGNKYTLMSEYILDCGEFNGFKLGKSLETYSSLIGTSYQYSNELSNSSLSIDMPSLIKEEYGFNVNDAKDVERVAYASDYAISKGVRVYKEGTARYWTNTESAYFSSKMAYYVTEKGAIHSIFGGTKTTNYGYRPIINIEYEEDK